MTPLLAFTQTSTYELTPPTQRLPPVLWSVFTALNKVHGMWRWYRRVDLYTRPNTFSQLLAGHVVNYVFGDKLLLRIAAQCLLISTRVLDCAKQQRKLCEATQQWIWAVRGCYPKPNKVNWDITESKEWLINGCNAFSDRIQRIIECTAMVFFQCFKLSMRIMDAIDVFSLNPETSNEGVNELFVNAMKWMDNIVENNEELLLGLENNKALIEKILYRSPFSYKQLHSTVSKTIQKTETVYKKAKAVSRFGDGILIELGSRMYHGARIVIGLR